MLYELNIKTGRVSATPETDWDRESLRPMETSGPWIVTGDPIALSDGAGTWSLKNRETLKSVRVVRTPRGMSGPDYFSLACRLADERNRAAGEAE